MLTLAITFWHWLAFGLLLVVVEVFAPGFVFFWLGLGAIITGAVLFLSPSMAWQFQLLLFACLSILSLSIWYFVARRWSENIGHNSLNRRGDRLEGQVFVLEEAIENGRGRIKVDDGSWVVMGDDMPKGARVRVTGRDGNVLRVDST